MGGCYEWPFRARGYAGGLLLPEICRGASLPTGVGDMGILPANSGHLASTSTQQRRMILHLTTLH